MKRFVFSLLCFLLGYVAFAQQYYSGKLTQAGEWLDNDTTPALPCACRWSLESNDTIYYFTKDSILFPEGDLVIEGEKYELGEEVTVFGMVYTQIDKGGHLRFCMEVLRIQRRCVGIIDKSDIWVSEVCTLEEDTTYKEVADYTITMEACEDANHDIRFLIPAHGIPDFVLAASNNDGSFSFSQKFRLGDGMDDEPYYLNIHGDGRVRNDSLTMKYVLASTGAYGSLQCAVKGVRQTVGVKGDKAVQPVSIFPNPIRDRFKINSDIELNEWQVYSVSGKLILSGRGADTEINCRDWAAGIYVFRWTTGNNETGFLKIIKE